MFSLKGRIGRKEFLIRMVLLIIASLILNFISSWFWGNSPMAPDHGLHHGGSLAALLVLIAALGVTWWNYSRRRTSPARGCGKHAEFLHSGCGASISCIRQTSQW